MNYNARGFCINKSIVVIPTSYSKIANIFQNRYYVVNLLQL